MTQKADLKMAEDVISNAIELLEAATKSSIRLFAYKAKHGLSVLRGEISTHYDDWSTTDACLMYMIAQQEIRIKKLEREIDEKGDRHDSPKK